MSSTSLSPSLSSARRLPSLRRLGAWIAASACRRETGVRFVIGFVLLHVALWTLALVNLKAAQDVHMDVAEAFAWGEKWQLGYGKHPPLSGWVAGVWFKLFPVTNWSTYLLAMTVIGFALVVCWRIALRVVEPRRAFLSVVMLALYPIFNFKGFKYNADLVQLITLPLVAFAYFNAFEKRTVSSGIWLGLAAAAAVMAKYWAFTMIGAIGLAALLHPQRRIFLRSPAPWIAMATFLIAMVPHLWWLKQVDFAPLVFVSDTYSRPLGAEVFQQISGYIGHNSLLLLLPIAVVVLAIAFRIPQLSPGWPVPRLRDLLMRQANPARVDFAQAINVWITQIVLFVGPPIGALIASVYMKSDWGIPLFFLVPLAVVAIPSLQVPLVALARTTAVWLILSIAVVLASPSIASLEMTKRSDLGATYLARAQLAQELTQLWRNRFKTRWAVVAGATDIGEPMTFYSPDHPAPYTPRELWGSGLTSLDEARRLGFIGICDPTAINPSPALCESWMKETAPNAEQVTISTQRFYRGHPGPSVGWKVFIVPPAS